MAHTGRRLKVTYWMKVRTRETHDLPIAGGQKRGSHQRRVTRWAKWKTHQAASSRLAVLERDTNSHEQPRKPKRYPK